MEEGGLKLKKKTIGEKKELPAGGMDFWGLLAF